MKRPDNIVPTQLCMTYDILNEINWMVIIFVIIDSLKEHAQKPDIGRWKLQLINELEKPLLGDQK